MDVFIWLIGVEFGREILEIQVAQSVCCVRIHRFCCNGTFDDEVRIQSRIIIHHHDREIIEILLIH